MKNPSREYEIDDRQLYEWLPWGGLIHPNILRNKDDSLLGVFSYHSKEIPAKEEMTSINFKNGWVIWVESQKFHNEFHNYIVITWNPFFVKRDIVNNTLSGKPIPYEKMTETFAAALKEIEQKLRLHIDCKLLENEEILSYLYSTLAMANEDFPMPEIPLYLDVLISEKVEFKVIPESFILNKKHIKIISLLGLPETAVLSLIPYDYRVSRRMLIFGEKESQLELERYTQDWCRSKTSMKEFIWENLLSNLNGYYTTSLIFFHEDEETLQNMITDVTANFRRMKIPHIEEEYNAKDIWWGTLPGVFRANLTVPIVGLSGILEMLI